MRNLTPSQRQHVAERLIRLSRGNQTLTGCIVMATLGWAPSNPPRLVTFSDKNMIDEHGRIWAGLQKRGATQAEYVPIGTVEEVRDDLRQLCDEAKLDDDERREFFDEFKRWVGRDERAIRSGLII